jgi:hypothetical protein
MKPAERLEELLARARKASAPSVKDPKILGRIDYVCRCLGNRACVRLLMACMLAKLDKAELDVRQPYTKIGGAKCFSGRSYDESFFDPFC